VSEAKPVILVVEDDVDVADMLNAYFRVQGYQVYTANWGEDAIRSCSKTLPDLILLDIRLPDIDGFEVARRLRSNRRTREVPIIFLTEKRSRGDRLQGLELGADDYLTKPFDVQELRLRVRNSLRRSSQGNLTNPVTNLAEGPLVDERLRECLTQTGWAILVISLENLDTFRDTYGFVASDDVLRAISLMIHNTVSELGKPDDFLGQLSSSEFLLVTRPAVLQGLSDRIRKRMDQSLDYFYPLKDREGDARPGKAHLAVRLGHFLDNQGPFSTVDELKARLLNMGNYSA
jgi:DNA-binding response OmpR family regulator